MSEEHDVATPEIEKPKRANWRQAKVENAAKREAAVTVEAAPVTNQTQPNYRQERVKIILEENDNIPRGGQFFGINGAAFLLRPGVVADVPQGIIDVLNNAVMAVPVLDPNTLQVTNWRNKLRYPYRFADRL